MRPSWKSPTSLCASRWTSFSKFSLVRQDQGSATHPSAHLQRLGVHGQAYSGSHRGVVKACGASALHAQSQCTTGGARHGEDDGGTIGRFHFAAHNVGHSHGHKGCTQRCDGTPDACHMRHDFLVAHGFFPRRSLPVTVRHSVRRCRRALPQTVGRRMVTWLARCCTTCELPASI